MQFSPLLEQLIESLRCLPGVGPKTAQRMALQLLTRGRENGKRLAKNLLDFLGFGVGSNVPVFWGLPE